MAEAHAQPEKAFPVSWDQFHRDARALAWRLASSGPFTAIVAIKSFLAFVKKRAFSAFGWYRIVLAVVFFFLFVR